MGPIRGISLVCRLLDRCDGTMRREDWTMGRPTDVFVIDGDTVLKTPKPTLVRPGAGAQTVPLTPESRGAAATVAEHGSANRAVGASSLSLFVWGGGQWVNGDRDLAILLFLWQVLIVAVHYFVISGWSPIR